MPRIAMKTIPEFLPRAPIFADLDSAKLATLAGCARNVHFAEGERLLGENKEADVFYLIRHGCVRLERFVPNRGSVTIETVEEGGIVGWSWLLESRRAHIDARADSPVAATAFDGGCLRAKLAANHELAQALMYRFTQALIERLEATQLRMLDVYD